MAADRWQWSEMLRRYRDTKSGRFLSPATVLTLRDGYLDDRKAVIADLTARLVDGELAVGDWLLAMREQVRDLTLGEYAFGRGGMQAMTEADREAVANAISGQYAYLQAFAESVRAGDLTARQVGARANLYPAAARQAFERGKAAGWGLTLPAYPGEGSECRANCHCIWEINETDTAYRARWRLSSAEHCATCNDRAARWNPLIIKKEAA